MVPLWSKLEFGRCNRCGHEIALAPPATSHGWAHHITRSQRRGLPHWPAGHILTARCLREGCASAAPAPNLDFPVKLRRVLLGRGTDP